MFTGLQGGSLESEFLQPPVEAQPWVYWFWLNGNISSNGITADLEAMKRVGLGGALIMEVDQGAPVGPVDFMGAEWRRLFGHVQAEARRLGLEINLNNDAGWNGSGGPWIRPEQSMQEVVWSETNVFGPRRFEADLAPPPRRAGYYRDIAVQAFPAVGAERLANAAAKGAFQRRDLHPAGAAAGAPPKPIGRGAVTNLSGLMSETGRLAWDVPAGEWTIVRFGHTSTGVENAPAPASGRGLECDKLSPAGIEAQFAGMMARLAKDLGLEPGAAGPGLVATHIDSWENGSQNWTRRMPEEFRARRGYELWSYLPVLTGRALESVELSERFLWDLRQTVSELVIEHYAGRMRELARGHGMRFTVEAYGSPCDAIPYAGQADEPMGEFWTPSGALETCKGMASAAHIYGKRVVGAEACTAGDRERWLEHPALLKPHVDQAFCEGINRMVFHRYALQPWGRERVPGMTMGPWGQHYERTQTWWEWTPQWHAYLARCQFLLRQGLFVADICHVQPEAPPQGPGVHRRDGYDWDECTAEAVMTRMEVRDGLIVLPDGMSYRVLVLPWTQTMTPGLLRKVRELVQAGATVLGPRPTASPSLSGYPDCDHEVRRLAAEIWGEADGGKVREHRLGKGRMVWSNEPAKVLRADGVPPDFAAGQPLRFLHRREGDLDLYFVANLQPHPVTTTCTFRATGRVPELWWPETGRRERATLWKAAGSVTHVAIPFEASGSVFVVFREQTLAREAGGELRRDGVGLVTAEPAPPVRVTVTRAHYGVLDDPARRRDVTGEVQRRLDDGESHFPAGALAESGDPAPGVVKTLRVEYAVEGRGDVVRARDGDWVHVTPDKQTVTVARARYGVLDDPKRTRDMRARLQAWFDAGATEFKVADLAQGDDPAFLVVKTVDLEILRDGVRETFTGQDPDTLRIVPKVVPAVPPAFWREDAEGRRILEAREPGRYEWRGADGRTGSVQVGDLGETNELAGPWEVRFQAGRGAPAGVTWERLASLSTHPDPGVRYFAGEADYATDFRLAGDPGESAGRVYWLELGRVEAMARVRLNGEDLGTLWKPPYRIEVTKQLRRGENRLEVRVVTLWPNRMVGDEEMAEDSQRHADGTLQRWPDWLLEDRPSPAGRITFTCWRLWKKGDRLVEAGLLGPVRLVPGQRVVVR